MTFEVVLQHLGSSAIESPQCAVCTYIDKMNIRRLFTWTPFVQVFPVFIEHLYSVIRSIIYEYAPSLRINGDAMNIVEVAGPLVIGRISFLAPIQKELAVLVELGHSCSVVTVRHEHRAVGKPCQESGPVEMSRVG